MFLSIPTAREWYPDTGSSFVLPLGDSDLELLHLLEFWQGLPYELSRVEAVLSAFSLSIEGWKITSPIKSCLLPIDRNLLEAKLLTTYLKSRPSVEVGRYYSIQFARKNNNDESEFVDCIGTFDEHGAFPYPLRVHGASSERLAKIRGTLPAAREPQPEPKEEKIKTTFAATVSKQLVLQAHDYCERVLVGVMSDFSINPESFIKLGATARKLDRVPPQYCVDQSSQYLELPDLSSAKDEAEAAMLENVFVACKQLECQLLNRLKNKPSPPASELSGKKLTERRKECGVRNRELMDSNTKVDDRLTILKSEFPELDLDKKKLNAINRANRNARNRNA